MHSSKQERYSMSRFFKDRFAHLEAYTPGEQPQDDDIIKLNSNENPYQPTPHILAEADMVKTFNRYPDLEASELVKALSDYYDVGYGNIMVGNGSDEILAWIFMAFEGKFYFPDITYGFYPVFADAFMCEYEEIPLSGDLTICSQDYANLDGNIIIANPNAPVGSDLGASQIREILLTNKEHLVIIDEAYVDFGAETMIPLIEEFDNLVVVQTFSKSRSLAGGRVGMVFANPEIISDLKKIKYCFNPYNLDKVAIRAGKLAIEDADYFQMSTNRIMKTRSYFSEEMKKLGFEVPPSKGNFVLVRSDKIPGMEYYLRLKGKKIIVRHFEKERISDYVRITIGREEDMERVLEATAEILQERERDLLE